MRIVKPSVSIESNISYGEALRIVENATRVCYKSEDKIKEGSAEKLIKGVIKAKHLGCIEHVSLTVKFICDRACSHQLVRHRLMSFNQKSQRYCKEDNLEVIKPEGLKNTTIWLESCRQAENAYAELIRRGEKPEIARGVLPNSTATEIYATANLREWRHFLKLRTAQAAHPQMRELTIPLLKELKEKRASEGTVPQIKEEEQTEKK